MVWAVLWPAAAMRAFGAARADGSSFAVESSRGDGAEEWPRRFRHGRVCPVGASSRSWDRLVAIAFLLLWTRSAPAQDATVLVVALAPPILLAPLVLTIGRLHWLRGISRIPIQVLLLLAVSCLEVLLWLVILGAAAALMTGDSGLWAVVPLAAAVAINWVLSRIWLDSSRRAARWLSFLSPLLVLVLLAAVTWVVLASDG